MCVCVCVCQLKLSQVVGRKEWNPPQQGSIPTSDMMDVDNIDSICIFLIPHMEYTMLYM